MTNRFSAYIVGVLFSLFCTLVPIKAQNEKTITLAHNMPYTESISLKKDARDMDIIMKIYFNEMTNTLSISLMSYRTLFVFQDNVTYKQIIRNSKLRPEKFPYVVESDPETTYKLTDEIKDQMPGCNKKFTFHRWLNYEGLMPQPTDYKMVNDYIEQKFDVLEMDTVAFISLHDILVMEPSFKKKNRFNVFHLARLDNKYKIRITRNPCIGKEEDIESAKLYAEAIRTGYKNLYLRYTSENNFSQESIQVLEEMRIILEQQFPRRNDTHSCPTVMNYIREYNNYVDSIGKLKEIQFTIENKRPHMPLPAERIMGIAKIIDRNVARWLTTTDVVEKEELIKRSQILLDEVNRHLYMDVDLDANQQNAVDVFLKAEKYFKAICSKKKE